MADQPSLLGDEWLTQRQTRQYAGMSDAEAAEAAKAEFYRTPRETVMQLLRTARDISGDGWGPVNGLPMGLWVDAGAGDGAIWSVCRDDDPSRRFLAIELRCSAIQAAVQRHGTADNPSGCITYVLADWTAITSTATLAQLRGASVVTMNSPFSITHEFVQAAFDRCSDAWVWSLQRQSWGKPAGGRSKWLMEHWPEYKLQCVGRRPSFTEDGKTDPCEYIWYGWSPTGRNRTFCRYEGPCRKS